jgi:hypothetical protein
MKKLAFAVLIAVNVGLLLTLIAGSGGVDSAQAQARGTLGKDFAMISGQLDGDEDLVYIVDLSSGQMIGLTFDDAKEQPVRYRGVNLAK